MSKRNPTTATKTTTTVTSSKSKPRAKKNKDPIPRSSVPAAQSLVIKARAPKQIQMRDVYTVSHLEYLGDIAGSTSPFSLSLILAINPGMPTFPWLSPIASAYEAYKFRKLQFIYAGRTSSATGGYCTLAIDYDPSDPSPASKLELNNYNDRVAVVPWESKAVLQCNQTGLTRINKYMTRGSSIADDLGLYDTGNLYVATGNQASNVAIGELWVEYTLDFYQPQTNRAGPLVARSNAGFNFLNNVNYVAGTFTIPFANIVYNPFGFTDTAGVISGVAGVFTIYSQIQYTATLAPTTIQLNILKNGVSIQNVSTPGALSGTLNLQVIASLTATDTISVAFVAVGGTAIVFPTGAPPGSANTLQLTPA